MLKANVRVIAATNRDLREAVERRRLPRGPLLSPGRVRDRICRRCANGATTSCRWRRRFSHEIGRSLGRPPAGSRATPSELLLAYDWPGNVRELRNVLERAAILCGAGRIAREHLQLHSRRAAPSVTSDLQTVERRRIQQVMRETDGNKSRAASRLGLTRTQLYVRLRRYDLERPAVA